MARMTNIWEVSFEDGFTVKVAAGDYDDAAALAIAARSATDYDATETGRITKAQEVGNVWVDCQ